MRVLVSGGAGYIGAHVVRLLAERGHTPVVLDDLRGSSLERVGPFDFEKVALEDTERVLEVFRKRRPEAVVHLGGYISVGESVRHPDKYWANNLGAGASLLVACARHPIQTFIFSSTAAVYGNAERIPIPEDLPLAPTSPYGSSKLAFEQLLHSTAQALGFTSVALRYFNASGARTEWNVGESHSPEEHLIPRVIRAIRSRNEVEVFGNDYPTRDGTCVRDYIHVWDLATAHVLALETQPLHRRSVSFNVGTGLGHSVHEVIREIATRLAVTPNIKIMPRRPGDPASLVADPSKITAELGWTPAHSTLGEIVGSALDWESARHGS